MFYSSFLKLFDELRLPVSEHWLNCCGTVLVVFTSLVFMKSFSGHVQCLY